MTRQTRDLNSEAPDRESPVDGSRIGGLIGLIATTACPTCNSPLQAYGEDPDPYCVCGEGHQFTVEKLLELWAHEPTPSIKKYLSVLEISEEWCRRMASRALYMGLSVVAANYHERAMLAESRAALIRQGLVKSRR